MKCGRTLLLFVSASLVVVGGSAIPAAALGQDAPPHYIAAPDVYKLLGENDQFRVIEATWKPGQRDAWHSHSGGEAAYRLTDCKSRIYTPDGKFREVNGKAGEVNFNAPIASHSFENVGITECRALIVQKK